MDLTREEESIFNGEQGEGAQKAMELVVALGKIYEAQDLIDITSAHLSGASYKTIGDGGLKYLDDMVKSGAKVSVPSTLNPVGMDRERWKEMHITPQFAEKQLKIIDLYGKMGIKTTCSCTPYMGDNVPSFGDHVAWAESSALSFVNSYIGARTNREGGPGALAAAILGKTANYGLHLDENRKPTVVIDADIDGSVFSYSMLGQAVGMAIGGGVPYFRGIKPVVEDAKTLSAAMAAAGSVALYHVEGVTPEAGNFDVSDLDVIHIGKKELQEAYDKLNTTDDVQLIALGCPHLSVKEIHDIAMFLKGKKKRNKDVEVWFCTSSIIRDQCPEDVRILEEFGPVLADTCMVVAPIEGIFQRTGTNSAKAGNYLPTLCSQKAMCRDITKLMDVIL
ncbi:MAG: aconitase X catalytic domain-containing protein [Candidatus Methanomethylophilaceae archaeon]|nr:aconitase X catalytic domain-containing protein [Candidatus Methanomethylophilaceae archaeon]MDD3378684.1 aconitase X catalytic domain-containing protein [Candidatus Methanomethylophilaceae archaeon]MDY0224106.1 aconitase X catalytic domain-containing protein [Candidatus Methanomethylophilaceae archaeon]